MKVNKGRLISITLIVIGILLISIVCTGNRLLNEIPEGGIFVYQPICDLPRTKGISTYKHTFRIYNFRSTTLEVDAHPGCGCTRVGWAHAQIKPMRFIDLPASIKYDGREGEIDKEITLITNRSDAKYVFLRFVKQR